MFFILIIIAGLYSINYHSVAFFSSWLFLGITFLASAQFLSQLKEHPKPTFNLSSCFTHFVIFGIYLVLYHKDAPFIYYIPILLSQLVTLVVSFYYWYSANQTIKTTEDNFIDSLKK